MSELRNQTISGILWTSVERFGTLGISFATNVILARLLTPDDFGIIGMLAIFIALSNTFLEGGFGAALIQKRNPSQTDYSTVLYWNIFFSVFLYVVLFSCSPLIAVFFHNEKLIVIIRVQALILIPNSLSVVHSSILRKTLQFKKLARIILIPSFLSAIIGITLAYNGWGVWSLVAFQLSNSLFLTIFYWYSIKWTPSFVFDFQSFRRLFSYGGFILISNLLNTLMDNIQGLLIGRKFSAATMGFYTQARKLEDIPATSLSSITSQVTFPVFSKIYDDKKAVFEAHRKITIALNAIVFPLMSLLIVLADPIFIVIFSEKWVDSIPLFRVLCLGGMANCLISVNYNLYISSGKSKQMFKWNTIKQLFGLVNIIIGLHWGVVGMLYGMVVNSWCYFLIHAFLSKKISGYTVLNQLKDCLPIFIVSVITSLFTWGICSYLINNMVFHLVLGGIIFVFFYIVISLLLKLDAVFLLKSILAPYVKMFVKNRITPSI